MDDQPFQETTVLDSIPVKKGPSLVLILVFSIFFLILISVAVLSYMFGALGRENPAPSETPIRTIAPTTKEIETIESTFAPLPAIENTPNLKTFTSDVMKISFDYLEYQPDNPKDKITTRLLGNRVFVNFASYSTEGQHAEVFKKDKSESAAEAIKRLFLDGISDKDCFVKETTDSKKYPQNFTTWVIAYPVDPNSEIPEFAQDNKCPQGYTQTNGIAYFLGDITHPEQFLFLSIGQYGIYADGDKMWQDTIKFL